MIVILHPLLLFMIIILHSLLLLDTWAICACFCQQEISFLEALLLTKLIINDHYYSVLQNSTTQGHHVTCSMSLWLPSQVQSSWGYSNNDSSYVYVHIYLYTVDDTYHVRFIQVPYDHITLSVLHT